MTPDEEMVEYLSMRHAQALADNIMTPQQLMDELRKTQFEQRGRASAERDWQEQADTRSLQWYMLIALAAVAVDWLYKLLRK